MKLATRERSKVYRLESQFMIEQRVEDKLTKGPGTKKQTRSSDISVVAPLGCFVMASLQFASQYVNVIATGLSRIMLNDHYRRVMVGTATDCNAGLRKRCFG
jgi:hypothetical protein